MQHARHFLAPVVVSLVGLGALGGCSDDDTQGAVDLAIFAVDPEQIIFNDTAVGTTTSRQIIIENAAGEGSTDLLINLSLIHISEPTRPY